MRHRRTVALAALLALGLAACSSSGSGKPARSEPTPSTTTAAPTSTTGPLPDLSGAPRITGFGGPPSPVTCTAPTEIELHWATPVTATVELRINGGDVFASYPGGKGDHLVPLACDGTPQTYELTATGGDGSTASKTLTIDVLVPN
jgi:hypothetical protein